jgi:hypothetical protein
MQDGKIVNNKLLSIRSNLNVIFFNFFGFNFFFKKLFAKRCEYIYSIELNNYLVSQWFSLLNFFFFIVPKQCFLKKKWLANICVFDLFLTYKGWRHFKGLPVRGQRTWTNANTSYRSNLNLRQVKLNISKKIYGNISVVMLNISNLAEQINILWKSQWNLEWKEAKKKRVMFLQKNNLNYKVDLYAMSKNVVWGFTKKKSKGAQQKKNFKNNFFTLGFDPGFTKNLIKNFAKSDSSAAVLNYNQTQKKKIKKKAEIKKVSLKKKKSSQWE